MSHAGTIKVPRFPSNADVTAATSKVMRSIRSRDTRPELAVRSLLHRMGHRFRLHRRDLPGTPDLVLPKYRVAVLVHGCFWHQHADCRHARLPSKRRDYWLPKLARTQQRDAVTVAALNALGWRALIVWECETTDEQMLRMRFDEALTGTRLPRS